MRKCELMVVALAVIVMPVLSLAQAPQGIPQTIRGTVLKRDGQMLTVKSRAGQQVTVTLAPDLTVRAVIGKRLANIKAGDYVASTSVRGRDGKLHAVEVTIFPETLRGRGEGQSPYDLVPQGLMTNATVGGVSRTSHGRVLQITYKGQTSDLVVGLKVPVVAIAPGDASLLKRGAFVVVRAVEEPDGRLITANITAEKNGVKPPM
jgi:hypothetical protein